MTNIDSPINNVSVGFLISDLSRLLKKVYDRRVSGLGVTRSQWSVLVQLKRSEGLTQCALAELVEIEQPSLVRHLDRLEECGLLVRKGDKEDRRAKRVFLTKKSASLLQELEKEGLKLRAEFLRGLGEKEQETLLRLLGKMKENLLQLQEREGLCKDVD